MAGNSRSGRKRLSIEEHLDKGTYRADRHGAAPDAAEGLPAMPAGMTPAARACWKSVVEELIAQGRAKAIDTFALQQLCEVWGLYRAALKVAAKHPVDPAARGAVTGYLNSFQAIGRRFGVTFGDRQKLKVKTPAAEKGTGGIPSRQRA